MKAHKRLVFAGCMILLGGCSSPMGPATMDGSGKAGGDTYPRYGVMYGSGNRSGGDQEGGQQSAEAIMAADSVETTATVAGGVMYGSGN